MSNLCAELVNMQLQKSNRAFLSDYNQKVTLTPEYEAGWYTVLTQHIHALKKLEKDNKLS